MQARDNAEVLEEILTLGEAFNDVHQEDRSLVIRPSDDGHVVATWAIYPKITRYDVWTYAPDVPRALTLLRDALRQP